jgi:tol-pal system-associated acyl-CoA thioesterase
LNAVSEFSLPLRVYIEDTDAGGIVYYVNYLKFMERARTEFMRSLGFGKTALFDDHAMFVVTASNIQYYSSAKLDDELEVTATPVKVGRASIVFDQQVKRADKILCKAEVKIACVDRQTGSPQAMPESMYTHVNSTLS